MINSSETEPTETRWSRFWHVLLKFEDAMGTSDLDFLQRRVRALEKEVEEIKASQPQWREIRLAGQSTI